MQVDVVRHDHGAEGAQGNSDTVARDAWDDRPFYLRYGCLRLTTVHRDCASLCEECMLNIKNIHSAITNTSFRDYAQRDDAFGYRSDIAWR